MRGWLGALLVVTFACGGSPSSPRVAKRTFALLEAGAEPRQRLRYAPVLHVPERMEMRLKFHVAAAATNPGLTAGRWSTGDPAVRFAGRVEVTAITPDGEAMVTYVVEDASLLEGGGDPAVRRSIEAEIAALKGCRGSWRMSPLGTLSEIVFDAPRGSGSTPTRFAFVRDMIPDTSVVFPEAEIGVGATWQATSRHAWSGVMWDREATYRLRELAGSVATVEVDVVMRAPPQSLSVEPNASTRLTSGTSHTSVKLSVPLQGLVATGTSRGTFETNFAIVRGGQRAAATLQSETLLSVKPLGAPETSGAP